MMMKMKERPAKRSSSDGSPSVSCELALLWILFGCPSSTSANPMDGHTTPHS